MNISMKVREQDDTPHVIAFLEREMRPDWEDGRDGSTMRGLVYGVLASLMIYIASATGFLIWWLL